MYEYTIGPSYTVDPIFTSKRPLTGQMYTFSMPMNGSRFYDCTAKTHSAPFDDHGCLEARTISVYVPAAYVDGDEAGVLLAQDGPAFQDKLPPVMDWLIANSTDPLTLPVFIAIFVGVGTKTDGVGSLRDLQYDTVSGKYADFLSEEVLVAVRTNVVLRADYPKLRLTSNPDGRMLLGCSSGGAASFTAAWFRPEYFRRVVAYSAVLIHKDLRLPSNVTYPLGAWEYHAPPAELIASTIPPPPLRIFHSAADRDLGATNVAPYVGCDVVTLPNGSTAQVVANATVVRLRRSPISLHFTLQGLSRRPLACHGQLVTPSHPLQDSPTPPLAACTHDRIIHSSRLSVTVFAILSTSCHRRDAFTGQGSVLAHPARRSSFTMLCRPSRRTPSTATSPLQPTGPPLHCGRRASRRVSHTRATLAIATRASSFRTCRQRSRGRGEDGGQASTKRAPWPIAGRFSTYNVEVKYKLQHVLCRRSFFIRSCLAL